MAKVLQWSLTAPMTVPTSGRWPRRWPWCSTLCVTDMGCSECFGSSKSSVPCSATQVLHRARAGSGVRRWIVLVTNQLWLAWSTLPKVLLHSNWQRDFGSVLISPALLTHQTNKQTNMQAKPALIRTHWGTSLFLDNEIDRFACTRDRSTKVHQDYNLW
jgi:hypothetical protein